MAECKDTVSRQVAIDTLLKWMRPICINNGEVVESDDMVAIRNILKSLPLAQSERKKGKWLCSDDLYETAVCSCCGWDTTEPWQHIKSWFEFCPHCGADMRG